VFSRTRRRKKEREASLPFGGKPIKSEYFNRKVWEKGDIRSRSGGSWGGLEVTGTLGGLLIRNHGKRQLSSSGEKKKTQTKQTLENSKSHPRNEKKRKKTGERPYKNITLSQVKKRQRDGISLPGGDNYS